MPSETDGFSADLLWNWSVRILSQTNGIYIEYTCSCVATLWLRYDANARYLNCSLLASSCQITAVFTSRMNKQRKH